MIRATKNIEEKYQHMEVKSENMDANVDEKNGKYGRYIDKFGQNKNIGRLNENCGVRE